MTIYVATAEGSKERGGVYHADPFRQAAKSSGVEVVSLVEDLDLVDPDQRHLATTPAAVTPRRGDVLVITSAEEFPRDCVMALPDLPVVVSHVSALAPEPTKWSGELDLASRASLITVQSEAGWPDFATAIGVAEDHPHVVLGTPSIDAVPTWHAPHVGDMRVAVPTLVRGETPQAEYPLDAAKKLRAAGFVPVICPHPREDLEAYVDAGFQIADKRTVAFIAGDKDEPGVRYVVGPAGTVNAELAALSREERGAVVGPRVVALTAPGQTWPPDYLLAGATKVLRGDDVVDALRSARPATLEQAEHIVGPVGGAAQRHVDVWSGHAARSVVPPSGSERGTGPLSVIEAATHGSREGRGPGYPGVVRG